jgi:hypothetical protein
MAPEREMKKTCRFRNDLQEVLAWGVPASWEAKAGNPYMLAKKGHPKQDIP